jgi:hypothetical protein
MRIENMKPFPTVRLLASSTICSALIACAGTAEPPAPTVVRARPPQAYEKTINNYFAFKIRGSQKNAQISVGQPEPSSCALDGGANSMRGWVVVAAYETRTGELTGKETIKITAKPYYFWFLGDTIAGVTSRLERCPGLETAFDEVAPPPKPDTQQGQGVDPTEPSKAGVKTPSSQKGETAQGKKKPAKPAKKSSAPQD